MNAIRLVIADDHPVVRAGVQGMLNSQSDFDVVGEADNGKTAVELCLQLCPDVVLLDLRMPELDGVGAIRLLRGQANRLGILVLTTYDTDADILRAVEAGATGYLLKDAPREELFRAIRSAARGETVFASTVLTKLKERTQSPTALSAREVEVLSLVAKGTSNKDIGCHLYISEATVKSHLIHIFNKLEAADRTAAVTIALERGIL